MAEGRRRRTGRGARPGRDGPVDPHRARADVPLGERVRAADLQESPRHGSGAARGRGGNRVRLRYAGHEYHLLERVPGGDIRGDRKSTRLNSSHVAISYAVFCLKKTNTTKKFRNT